MVRANVMRPNDNAAKINILILSGIPALPRNGEMFKALNGLEKYGVMWPDTWGFTPKMLFGELASLGITLSNDANVGAFIFEHLPISGELHSSTLEEKARQTTKNQAI